MRDEFIQSTCTPTSATWEKWNRPIGFFPENGTDAFQGPWITEAGTIWAFGQEFLMYDGTPVGSRDIDDLEITTIRDENGNEYSINENRRLQVSNPDDGKVIHIFEGTTNALPTLPGDGAGVATIDSGIVSFDTTSFDVLWRYDADQFVTLLAVDDSLIFLRESQWYTILDRHSGMIRTVSIRGASGLTLTPDNTVIYRPAVNALCKATRYDLSPVWCVEEEMDIKSMTVDKTGNIYVAVRWPNDAGNGIFSIDFTTGEYRWFQPTEIIEPQAALMINLDHTLVYKRPSGLENYSLASGRLNWRFHLQENEIVYNAIIGASGDYFLLIKDTAVQTYRLVRLDHIFRNRTAADLYCVPCQINCEDIATLARCRPDGSGFMAQTKCPTGTECRFGRCTECIQTPKRGCAGQDFVFLDSCRHGYRLIRNCHDLICDDDEGCPPSSDATDPTFSN
jgi:outer membrane protein assembly factor BamB